MTEVILLILLLIVLSVFMALFIRQTRHAAARNSAELDSLRTELENSRSEIQVTGERLRLGDQQNSKLEEQLNLKEQTILDLNRQLSGLSSDYKALESKLREQKGELETLQERFRSEFRNLANDILEEKTKKFTEQNTSRLDEILKPLGERIRDFEKKVEETYDRESKQRFSLEKEIRNLAELNTQISKEANNLTNALKGQSKTRGNWGEVILETILEKSGLTRDREFFIQQSFTNEHGRRIQPDVIVAYPGERNVVIDSKVALVAYEKYASAESREAQEQAAREHLLAVRNHINDLSSKNYQDLYALQSLDFVMLFMPIEPAYLLAMQYDPNLWNYAYDRRILLISPTNLIAALRMIANLWRVEYQNKNVQEIARQSGELYDKFVGFLEDLKDVGSKIEATHKTYDAAMNKLSTGKGNLIRRVENLKTLGARTGKEIPKSMLERANDD
ncbi:MAG: DNA recombination protein RmuC [Bacteroidales bacterium]|nr:DNA recombination protein RmuC [Bacteroidales bacterium]HNW73073.1 DNA recombination protein RmuC [Bacteroidales bacterium]HPS50981.1 DNA recombination protein RmuC [Bacteroidales bacterium]